MLTDCVSFFSTRLEHMHMLSQAKTKKKALSIFTVSTVITYRTCTFANMDVKNMYVCLHVCKKICIFANSLQRTSTFINMNAKNMHIY